MKKLRSILISGAASLVLVMFPAGSVLALTSGVGEPEIRQINITGDEFIVIQNVGADDLDLGNYWLGYASGAAATAGPSEQLPDVTLNSSPDTNGEKILLSTTPMPTCGAVVAGKLPFSSFSNSAGTLSLWRYDNTANPASFSLLSSLSWDKSGSQAINLDAETGDSDDNWYLPLATSSGQAQVWEHGELEGCAFTPVQTSTGEPDSGSVVGLAPISDSDYPKITMLPVKYIATKRSGNNPSLPASDRGLKPPLINELLPNPASPQTDADDEFIELYNPNKQSFDLSGFKLETGSTSSDSRHDYTFPDGTVVKAKSMIVVKSAGTSLSLTNGGGQAWLLDPFSKVVSKSGVWGKAKSGMAFAMGKGKWYWTILPTPGKANIVQKVARSSGQTNGSVAKSSPVIDGSEVEGVKGASTAKSGDTSSSTLVSSAEPSAPIHPIVLAVVAGLAVAYFLYEYRNDLSNKILQFKKYRAARRAGRG